jgi:endonuclease YncB( thermonuclease family)
MFSNNGDGWAQPNLALAERPSPATLRRPIALLGILLYLVSVALIAAAILGVSFGIGFYLLVHPAAEMAADPAQSPAAHEAAASNKRAAAPEPVPASSAGEAPAATASAASPGDELLVPGSAASELTIAVPNTQAVISELPSDASAYVRRNPVEPDEIAGVPRGPLEGQTSEPSNPTSSEPKSSAVIRGIVTDVPNVATWVILGRTVRLLGIDPGPPNLLASLVNWVRAKGPVECLPQARTGRYQCFTATGEDIAESALLAGVGRVGNRAGAAYRNAESRARQKGKGLWAGR